MGEIIQHIIYFIFVLPVLIASEGWGMFKQFMNEDQHRWRTFYHNLPYILIVILTLVLVILLIQGYR